MRPTCTGYQRSTVSTPSVNLSSTTSPMEGVCVTAAVVIGYRMALCSVCMYVCIHLNGVCVSLCVFVQFCHTGAMHGSYRPTFGSESNHPLPSPLPLPPIPPPSQFAGLVTRLRRPPVQLVPNQPSLSSMFDDKWEIDKKNLQLGKELGSGQFGVCSSHSCDFTLTFVMLPCFHSLSPHPYTYGERGRKRVSHFFMPSHIHHTAHSPLCVFPSPTHNAVHTMQTLCTVCSVL